VKTASKQIFYVLIKSQLGGYHILARFKVMLYNSFGVILHFSVLVGSRNILECDWTQTTYHCL